MAHVTFETHEGAAMAKLLSDSLLIDRPVAIVVVSAPAGATDTARQ